jgi:hypothetical protein
MSSNDADTDHASPADFPAEDVGPTLDLADVPLPADVGQGIQTLYGTEDPPRDAAAWIAATRAAIEDARGSKPTVADLCDARDGDHRFEARDGEFSQAYVCVIDPLAYPFITATPGTIRSQSQVRDETLTVEITADGLAVSHPDAVVSIGVSDHVDAVDEVTPEVVYRQICGYIHLFADGASYQAWAAEADAATTAVPVETGVGLSKAIARTLFA